jgi:hypothetical protein
MPPRRRVEVAVERDDGTWDWQWEEDEPEPKRRNAAARGRGAPAPPPSGSGGAPGDGAEATPPRAKRRRKEPVEKRTGRNGTTVRCALLWGARRGLGLAVCSTGRGGRARRSAWATTTPPTLDCAPPAC